MRRLVQGLADCLHAAGRLLSDKELTSRHTQLGVPPSLELFAFPRGLCTEFFSGLPCVCVFGFVWQVPVPPFLAFILHCLLPFCLGIFLLSAFLQMSLALFVS